VRKLLPEHNNILYVKLTMSKRFTNKEVGVSKSISVPLFLKKFQDYL
jgi:hypothetical protein